MLTKGVFKDNIAGDSSGSKHTVPIVEDLFPTSRIVAFPEISSDEPKNLKPLKKDKPSISSSAPTPKSPTRKAHLDFITNEAKGEKRPPPHPTLAGNSKEHIIPLKSKTSSAESCSKPLHVLRESASITLQPDNAVARKRCSASARLKKQTTLSSSTRKSTAEWLISFSTLDNRLSNLQKPSFPYDFQDVLSRPISAAVCERTSLVTVPQAQLSDIKRAQSAAHPISTDIEASATVLLPNTPNARQVRAIKLTSTLEKHHVDTLHTSVPFSSLNFEAKGFYSIKLQTNKLEIAAANQKIVVSHHEQQVAKLTGVWKDLKAFSWKDKKKKNNGVDAVLARDTAPVCQSLVTFLENKPASIIEPLACFTGKVDEASPNSSVEKCQDTMQSSGILNCEKYHRSSFPTSQSYFNNLNSATKEGFRSGNDEPPSVLLAPFEPCPNSVSADQLSRSCFVNQGLNSSDLPIKKPKSFDDVYADDKQSCSMSDATNHEYSNTTFAPLNLTHVAQLERNICRESFNSKVKLIEDESLNHNNHFVDDKIRDFLFASPVRPQRKAFDCVPERSLQDAKIWHYSSPMEMNGDANSSCMELIVSPQATDVHKPACVQNGMASHATVLSCNILRTSYIDDHSPSSSYDGETKVARPINNCSNNGKPQMRSTPFSKFAVVPSISSSAGSCGSLTPFGRTESSAMNTSRMSLDSMTSSSVSESNPLKNPLQTVAGDSIFERADEQAHEKWREAQHTSDSEDSDADAHSDICESLESLVDHGLDSDASILSEASDVSDDESMDMQDETKSYEEKDAGTDLSSPDISTTVSDDFTTISLTRDYYPVKEDPPIGTIGQAYPWIRFSLFPNVPPTINFRVMDTPPLFIPPEVKRILKWKSTAVTPAIIRRVLYNSGMRIVKRSRQWIGIWSKHMRANLFKTIKDFQKFNHFPGTFQIGRKDTLWRNHIRLRNIHGKKNYDFLPVTFVIPSDMKQLRHAWEKSGPHQMWIIKPPASARGTGIKIIHKFMQIPKIRPLIVQKYLSSPFLINGVKFDLRIYVYITSFYPLRIYVYKEGLVRFASVMYSSCPRTVSDRYMHLTNYSVNRKSVTYTANEDVNACKGHKWSLKALWGYLTEKGYDTAAIWNSIVDIVIKTIISCDTTVSTLTRLNLKNANSCHELFGFDIILDSNLKPWLLEVNISPSLQSSSKLDASIKGQMCKDLLNLSGVTIPPHLEKTYQTLFLEKLCVDAGFEIENLCFDKRLYRTNLSVEERAKQIAFSRMERHDYLPAILQNLLPDDFRQLVIAEDERSRAGQYIRVYPSSTSHRYHKFFDRPRYYNHLFDAWETQYSGCRMDGIQRLVGACRNGLHVKAVIKDSSKVSSPRTELGRLSSSSSLRIRCCSRSATNRAIQRACRSARNLFARMRLHRHCPPSKNGHNLEDTAKSSFAGSGDHLLRSKTSDKETEGGTGSSQQTSVSPPSRGVDRSFNNTPQPDKHIIAANDVEMAMAAERLNNSEHQNSSSGSSNTIMKYPAAKLGANGGITHHCRGCALLSQRYYLSNSAKLQQQLPPEFKETDQELRSENVPVHSSGSASHAKADAAAAFKGLVDLDAV